MGFVPLETLIGDHLTGQIVLMEPETATLVGALGMLMLAASWWMAVPFSFSTVER